MSCSYLIPYNPNDPVNNQVNSSGIKVSITYYDFSSPSFNEVVKNLEIEAAKVIQSAAGEGQAHGQCTWQIIIPPRLKIRTQRKNKIFIAYPLGLNRRLKIDIILPQWIDKATAHARDQLLWDIWFRKLCEHEYVHASIAIDAYEEMGVEFIKVTSTGKTESIVASDLQKKVQNIIDTIQKKYSDKQALYDRETDHSKNEEKQKEWSKLLTDEDIRLIEKDI